MLSVCVYKQAIRRAHATKRTTISGRNEISNVTANLKNIEKGKEREREIHVQLTKKTLRPSTRRFSQLIYSRALCFGYSQEDRGRPGTGKS